MANLEGSEHDSKRENYCELKFFQRTNEWYFQLHFYCKWLFSMGSKGNKAISGLNFQNLAH